MNLGARLARVSFWVGSAGLLGAMLIDSAAVLGRHLGVPLLGSIELVQACIVWMASASLVGTTLERGHASVHILTERLAAPRRAALRRAADLASALFFAFIAVGSGWLLLDLWHGAEQSELLGIPIAPLRVLWCASAAGVVASFTAQALARQSRT
ncbi:MAG TPA: TRAP transporter small permease subunit [Polyangiales bacterium]|nr:TRAP transporter small permease subunit [Polyangiales bacterium]